MAKLVIVRGVSGSGKSTWTREYVEKHNTTPGSVVVVNRDSIRKLLFGSEESYGVNEAYVTRVQVAMIEGGLLSDATVVVDNTNVYWNWVEELAEMARAFDAEIEIVTIDVPLATAKARNFMRGMQGGRTVPEDVIDNQHKMLQETKDYTLKAAV